MISIKRFASLILVFVFSTVTIANFNSERVKSFHCVGKKPNWNLELSGEKILLHAFSPGYKKIRTVYPLHAMGMRDGYLRVYKTETSHKHKPITIVIEDNPDGCTNGYSPTLHGYNTIVVLPKSVLVGCCDSVTLKAHRELIQKHG